jgi:hypothetical protein
MSGDGIDRLPPGVPGGYYAPQGRKPASFVTPEMRIIPDFDHRPLAFDTPPPLARRRLRGKSDHSLRERPFPPTLDGPGMDSNACYRAALSDPAQIYSPQALGFFPTSYWLPGSITFGDLVLKCFQRKNNANCRFPHKLFNALLLVDMNTSLWHYIGVQWVNDQVFKVDKLIFGRLLGIGAIDGGLFHQQGNFPSHGFAELTTNEATDIKRRYGLGDVDGDRVRLLHHQGGLFSRRGSEELINRCKWGTE